MIQSLLKKLITELDLIERTGMDHYTTTNPISLIEFNEEPYTNSTLF